MHDCKNVHAHLFILMPNVMQNITLPTSVFGKQSSIIVNLWFTQSRNANASQLTLTIKAVRLAVLIVQDARATEVAKGDKGR